MTDTTPPASNAPSPGNFAAQALSSFIPHRSAGLKLLLVCALALMMAIPAMFIFDIVRERSVGQTHAFNAVAERVGGRQAVLGPVLAVPYSHAPDENKPDRVVYGVALTYAETGTIDADVKVGEKKRGIHEIPVYETDLNFDASFAPSAIRQSLPNNAQPIWADARLYLGLSDSRGIKDAMNVLVNGKRVSPEPVSRHRSSDSRYHPVPESNLTLAGAEISGLENLTAPIKVTANLRVSGAERLAFGAFAKDTSVSLVSNWADPSFTGGFLPTSHTAGESDDGFKAEWRVPYIARGIPGSGPHLNLSDVTAYDTNDMAIRFVKEANPYQSVERALKYAAMFVGFVFLAYFLFEITSAARAHPAQYVLVGLAQTIFYLLLLAFSEKIGFDGAFGIAATMTVVLTSFYAATVFRSRGYGLRAFAILTGIYSLIFILMRAQDQALLAGALASFVAISLTMYMTRNIDWYGDGKTQPA